MSDVRPHGRGTSRWSWRVGSIRGIEIRVHATLALLLAWIAVAHLVAGHAVRDLLQGGALIVAVFAIVLVHELGHALMARRFGIGTRDITLLPIGGVSRIERMPDKPGQELLVAVAGPAVNFALAGVTVVLMLFLRSALVPGALVAVGGPFLAQFLWINLSLGFFNLLPAFPTDGGRALRALLAMRLAPARATEIAAKVGQAMAMLFAAVGLLYNPLLVIIAVFLYVSAQEEARWARLKTALAGVPVERAMITEFRTLDARDPLSRAAALVMAGAPPCFPVEEGGHLAGLLTHQDLVVGLATRGPEARVADVMHANPQLIPPGTPLERAVERARAGTPVGVERDGRLVGLITPESVADLDSFARTFPQVLRTGGTARAELAPGPLVTPRS